MEKSKKRISPATEFKKGQSGNPKGRPKKIPEIDALLGEVLGKENGDGKTEAQLILERLAKDAKGGNTQAAVVLLDRAYGKPKQAIDHTTDGEAINRIVIVAQPLTPDE